jgi:hypothetical protein
MTQMTHDRARPERAGTQAVDRQPRDNLTI